MGIIPSDELPYKEVWQETVPSGPGAVLGSFFSGDIQSPRHSNLCRAAHMPAAGGLGQGRTAGLRWWLSLIASNFSPCAPFLSSLCCLQIQSFHGLISLEDTFPTSSWGLCGAWVAIAWILRGEKSYLGLDQGSLKWSLWLHPVASPWPMVVPALPMLLLVVFFFFFFLQY